MSTLGYILTAVKTRGLVAAIIGLLLVLLLGYMAINILAVKIQFEKNNQNNEIDSLKNYENRLYPEFTTKEVADEKTVLKRYFKSINDKDAETFWSLRKSGKPYPSVNMADVEMTVKDIRYNSQYSERGAFVDAADNVYNMTVDNIIVFKCDFYLSITGIDPMAWQEGVYENFPVVLLRNNSSADWLITKFGY